MSITNASMMTSRLSIYFWLIFVFWFEFYIKSSYAQDQCKTPDGKDAKCVDIYQCQPILNIVTTLRRPHPPGVTRQLKEYKCNGELKVCCPKEPIILDSLELYQESPDITNHRNVAFLPENCGKRRKIRSPVLVTAGKDTALNHFPWMALLKYKTSKGLEFLCGGTIIHSKYILTAAHCLGLKDKELVSVRVGEYSIKNSTDCYFGTSFCNPPVQDLEVKEVIPHPQFERKPKNFLNDIALLRVPEITFAENISPVCLPVGKFRDYTYERTIVTGWGLTDSQLVTKADILQAVELPVVDKTKCSRIYGEFSINISNTQICIGGEGRKASCAGDSGGPIMVTSVANSELVFVQHGIISFGPSYCEIAVPGVNTQVKYYMDWILDNIKS